MCICRPQSTIVTIVTVISRCKDSYPLWFLLWSFIQKGPGQLYLACKYSWPGRSHLQGFASPCSLLFFWDCLISSRLKSDDVKSRLASSSASPWLHLWVNNWCRFWGYWKAVAAHLTKRSICFDLSLSHAIYFPSSLCGFDLAETAAPSSIYFMLSCKVVCDYGRLKVLSTLLSVI